MGTRSRSPVGVDHELEDIGPTPKDQGDPQGLDREVGGHPGVDGVADDAVGAGVLDRTEVGFALRGGVLGDLCEPKGVESFGPDLSADEVDVDRRARPAPSATLAGMDRLQLLQAAQMVDAAV
ncbi:hypothetical protein GCM10009528_35930 [Kineococcus aurantiacus]